MKIIGLTGGIASGKSTVAAYLELKGAVIVDADQIAREVVKKGEPAYTEIVSHFGEGCLHADGEIDRRRLAEIVFNDAEKLAVLNNITHPYIADSMREIVDNEKAIGTDLIVLDVPLPKKEGFLDMADEVWLIETEKEKQIDRLINLRSYTHPEAEARIKNQPDREEYHAAADVVITNSSDEAELIAKVDKLLNEA